MFVISRRSVFRIKIILKSRKFMKSWTQVLRDQKVKIVVSWPTYDWEEPLKQRPHHIASSLAGLDEFLYVFTTRGAYDGIVAPRYLKRNLILTSNFWDFAREADFIHVYANDPTLSLRSFKKIEKLGIPIIYEVLDEFDVKLQGGNTKSTLQRHEYALRSTSIHLVVVTAKKLADSVRNIMASQDQEKTILLLQNACDTSHFALKSYSSSSRSTIGYFGALASWFDYELINFIAIRHPDWTIALYGTEYDNSLSNSKVLLNKNVKYYGVFNYDDLPYQFDCQVAVIPFKINAITESTSPIKAFEYLSLGLPVIATALPECIELPLVSIGHTQLEFEAHLISELKNDSATRRIARHEFASQNTWQDRAMTLATHLKALGDR
jgi:teichuronic acid biosynthesis glycosyltransferase TuaH